MTSVFDVSVPFVDPCYIYLLFPKANGGTQRIFAKYLFSALCLKTTQGQTGPEEICFMINYLEPFQKPMIIRLKFFAKKVHTGGFNLKKQSVDKRDI